MSDVTLASLYLNGSNQQNISLQYLELPIQRPYIELTTQNTILLDADLMSPRIINITVSLIGALDAEEQLRFTENPSRPSDLYISLVTLDNITIVSVFGSSPAQSFYAALRTIAYSNQAEEPSIGERIVKFTIYNRIGSTESFAFVEIILVNDLPIIFLNASRISQPVEVTYIQGALSILLAPSSIVSDFDSTIVQCVISIKIYNRDDEIIAVNNRSALVYGITVSQLSISEDPLLGKYIVLQ